MLCSVELSMNNLLLPRGQIFLIQDLHGVRTIYFLFEPRHVISNNVVCATSKASDQPAHMRSLTRAFVSR